MRKNKTNRILARKIALSVVFALSMCVFLFSMYQIISYFVEGSQQKQNTETIIQEGIISVPVKELETETGTDSLETYEEEILPKEEEKVLLSEPDIQVNFEKLAETYPNIVGWIYMQGGAVHYPVMQGDDNEYYLSHLPGGKKNAAGSIFLDARDDANCSGFNQVLYGHNMKNGSMFAFVLNYRNGDYYQSNPYLFYFTKEGVYRAEIFAGVHTKSTSLVYSRPRNEEEISEYLSFVRKKSVFRSSVAVTAKDRVLVLSTCSGATGSDDRFAVLAKLVKLD